MDIFTKFPILETERLTLRDIRTEDAAPIYGMRSSGRVNQFIARNNMSEMESAEELVEKTIDAYKEKKAIGWAGVIKGQNEIIGTCGFNRFDFPNKRAEIGGEMSVEHWGKRLALEAVSAIVQFGFEGIGLHAIEAWVSPGNRGAIYLLEILGFEKEAHFKDRLLFDGCYQDMAVYTRFS